MHQIHINERMIFEVPSKMEELSKSQLTLMVWIFRLNIATVDKAKLMVLVQSLSLSFFKRLRLQFFYLFQANICERADLLFLTSSFTEHPAISTQKIKKLRVRFVLLHGPDSGLGNCTFWEFVQAEKYFLIYNETGNAEWLDKFIATLYRPVRKDYNPLLHEDSRIPLIDNATKFRVHEISRVNINTKMAILMWFDSARTQLMKSFPLIFKPPSKTEAGTKIQEAKTKAGKNVWMQLISEMAGSMDNYEKIGNTNLYIAMTDISHRIKKRQEEIAAAAKAARKRR